MRQQFSLCRSTEMKIGFWRTRTERALTLWNEKIPKNTVDRQENKEMDN